MKIALAQLNYHIGNFDANTTQICQHIRKAKSQGADLVVFAELSVCGYPPRDFLEFPDFIRRCNEALETIAAECTGIAAIVGAPAINERVEGKNLFNAAWFLADQKVQSFHAKALLPTYDVFDEYRYFEPAFSFNCIDYKGQRIALTVCEDLWDVEDDLMYTRWPMEELIGMQPTVMINIAASPFNYNHAANRRKVLARNVQKYGIPLVYVQQVGAQTEIVFDGGSLVLNRNAQVVHELAYFREDFQIVDLAQVDTLPPVPDNGSTAISRIHDALVLGIGDYFRKMGFKRAILGLSGGIDSAMVLVLAARALGPENVLPVLLPSEYSTTHSVDDSVKLCEILGITYDTIPIRKGYEAVLEMLQPQFTGTSFNVAEENIQARIRAITLMGIANKHGYILLNTTNKSEAAVGYGTLYGDMCGGIAVLGDVYKTKVYELARWINREQEIIPENIIRKAPSAELRPGQKDSDSLPEYDVLDQVLYQYIELRQGPRELVAMGFDEVLVNRVLKLVNSNEWKRAQFAPILRVTPKAFGSGRRMPIVGKYLG
ncbi:MAG: NAD+ synthase [Bacteroidetes bacterium]|nr:NAD+ synthase [Bacteroidota bacterium]